MWIFFHPGLIESRMNSNLNFISAFVKFSGIKENIFTIDIMAVLYILYFPNLINPTNIPDESVLTKSL